MECGRVERAAIPLSINVRSTIAMVSAQKGGRMPLPPPWDAYLRLQSTLDDISEVNNRSWSIEAGLDAILAGAVTPENLPTSIATAERRERHRARLRRLYPSRLTHRVDQPADIEARVEIVQVQRTLHPTDWHLISSVAMGMDYEVIGNEIGATPNALAVRVGRIRHNLRLAA
jgi:hypothetical protein